MPSLPPAIPAGTLPDGTLVTAAALWSGVVSLVEAIRARMNPKTTAWQAMSTKGGSLTDSTFTDAPLDTITIDTDDLGLDSNGFRAPAAGIYLVTGRGGIGSPASSGAKVVSAIAVNGSRSYDGWRNAADSTTSADTFVAVGASLLSLKRGDLVTMQVWENLASMGGASPSSFYKPTLTVVRYA